MEQKPSASHLTPCSVATLHLETEGLSLEIQQDSAKDIVALFRTVQGVRPCKLRVEVDSSRHSLFLGSLAYYLRPFSEWSYCPEQSQVTGYPTWTTYIACWGQRSKKGVGKGESHVRPPDCIQNSSVEQIPATDHPTIHSVGAMYLEVNGEISQIYYEKSAKSIIDLFWALQDKRCCRLNVAVTHRSPHFSLGSLANLICPFREWFYCPEQSRKAGCPIWSIQITSWGQLAGEEVGECDAQVWQWVAWAYDHRA